MIFELIIIGIPVAAAFIADQVHGAVDPATDHVLNAQGFVDADPQALARGAGVSLDTYALASMMVSEAGGENRATRVAVAWTAVNYCRKIGKGVAARFLMATKVGDGHFGKQSNGRYVATSKPPTSQTLEDAAAILTGRIADPTGGALNFDTPDPSLEDVDQVAANREAAGLESVELDGVDAFRFWRPT